MSLVVNIRHRFNPPPHTTTRSGVVHHGRGQEDAAGGLGGALVVPRHHALHRLQPQGPCLFLLIVRLALCVGIARFQ